MRENAARQARYKAGNPEEDSDLSLPGKGSQVKEAKEIILGAKKDFFGRTIEEEVLPVGDVDCNVEQGGKSGGKKVTGKGVLKVDNKIWVTYHEGFSNAVRKPITIADLMRGL